jgi:urease accessory protein
MCNFANHDLLADRGTTMRTGLITAALTLIPAAAFAHTGAGEAHGFASGFAHPLGGLDHILAMVTVGIFAWQLGGRALWLVPGSFVLAMTAGAALGMAGVALPFVEFGVAASVIVLGGVVAFARGAPIAIAIAVVALFAIFHGHAHGTEMPLDAAGGAYAAGFMLATALLHAAGIALGCAIGRVADGRAGYRLGGSLVALAGLAILSTMI